MPTRRSPGPTTPRRTATGPASWAAPWAVTRHGAPSASCHRTRGDRPVGLLADQGVGRARKPRTVNRRWGSMRTLVPMAPREAQRRLRGPLRCAGQFSLLLLYLPHFAAVLAAREALTISGEGL